MIDKQKLIELAERAGFKIDRAENVTQDYVIQSAHYKIDDELTRFVELLADAENGVCPVCGSECNEREAGLSITPPRSGQYNGGSLGGDVVSLQRFAALVSAAEREACAAECDARVFAKDGGGNLYRREATASQCATAIRNRGNNPPPLNTARAAIAKATRVQP